MSGSNEIILVHGATGQQGGAVTRHLLGANLKVRALVRDPGSQKAAALAKAGAELVKGDLYRRAIRGRGAERRPRRVQRPELLAEGRGLRRRDPPRKAPGRRRKGGRSEALRLLLRRGGSPGNGPEAFREQVDHRAARHRAGNPPAPFSDPAGFMENYSWQKTAISNGSFSGMGLKPDKSMQMVAVDDIGAFAALAFARPGDFLGKTVELSGDELTEPQIAAVFTKVIGREVKAAPPQMRGVPGPEMKAMQTFFSSRAYDADIPSLRKLYPSLHTLERWLRETGWERLQFCRSRPPVAGGRDRRFPSRASTGLTDRKKTKPRFGAGLFRFTCQNQRYRRLVAPPVQTAPVRGGTERPQFADSYRLPVSSYST